MGIWPPPENCFITNKKTKYHESNKDLIEYTVEINGETWVFKFPHEHQNSEFVNDNRYILNALILNDLFPKEYDKKDGFFNNEKLESLIRNSIYPKSPEEKANYFLNYLHSLQEYEGSPIKLLPKERDKHEIAIQLYFKNSEEMHFYLSTLQNMGFIKYGSSITKDGFNISDIKFTFDGLSKVIQMNESGEHSDRCFIAMSFSNNQDKTRETIKSVILKTGYSPIIIDEQHIDSDTTINDAIISEIKKSKFMVADFTQHKHGVYFETGFALGLKRPVIYTCSNEDFDKTHFDTNHYPHIIYNDLDELSKKLKDKIEAWIN